MKYRVWDKKEKRYLTDSELPFIVIDCNGKVYTLESPTTGRFQWTIDDITDSVVIEYATGRFDVKGNEIYQGDITRDEFVVAWIPSLTWDGGGSSHPGFYLIPKYCVESVTEYEMEYFTEFDTIEICGTIHDE